MRSEYPDLNSFETIMKVAILKNHPEFKHRVFALEFEAEVFPQIWSSTAGGFSRPGYLSGQEMTMTYTTVMKTMIYIGKERKEHIFYGIFFGNRSAYMVYDPTETFFTDLKNKKLKSVYDAERAY